MNQINLVMTDNLAQSISQSLAVRLVNLEIDVDYHAKVVKSCPHWKEFLEELKAIAYECEKAKADYDEFYKIYYYRNCRTAT